MFCKFHQTDTHNTRDCRSLPFVSNPVPRKAERRSPPIDRRRRTHEVDRTRTEGRHQQTPDWHRSPRQENRRASRERSRPSAREEENRSNTSRGEINVIAGGPTGGDSNRARKAGVRQLQIHAVGCSQERASGPEITFGPGDLEGVEVPHDDALLIKAVIANYTIHRIFVDTGSSVNIIFKKAFDQLQIDRPELLPMTTPLYGFTGNEVQPVGQIRLATSLGEEPLRRTRTINFVVVDYPSSYNVILGRPALGEF